MPKVRIVNITVERFAYYLFDLNILSHLISKTQNKLNTMHISWGKEKHKMKNDVLNQVIDLENILIFLNKYKDLHYKNL